jgi:hypothetical protein
MSTVIEKLIPLADAHQAADEYIAGTYWDAAENKGCTVGCTVEDAKRLGILNGVTHDNHAALARATDVPEMLWRLADHIFEGLPDSDRPGWTPRFLRAVRDAQDLANAPARIMSRLALRLAEDAMRPDVADVCRVASQLWLRRSCRDGPTEKEWDAAKQQADAAWHQAYAAKQRAGAAKQRAYAARQTADAAKQQAYAAWQQAYAAWHQADAAWQQAYAARQQAYAAKQQADAARQTAAAAKHQAYAARQTAAAVWQNFWQWCADMVCEECRQNGQK